MVQPVGVGHLGERELDVLIAGAGPTGLAMAAEAARFGLRYRLIDKAAHGALQSNALVIHTHTLEQFERYEIAQRAIECGMQLKRIRIYSDGKRILESSFDELPSNYPFVLFLPQDRTERYFTEHIEGLGGRVERNVALESFVDGVDCVECMLLYGDGTREAVDAAFLIGCDGAQSTVRRFLGVPRHETGDFDFYLGDMHVDGDAPLDEMRVYLRGASFVFIGRIDETQYRVVFAPAEIPEREPELTDFQAAIDAAGVVNVRVSGPRWMRRFTATSEYQPFYGGGRVFLAGEAAAVYTPLSGEALNAGVQDAGNLMWKIALVRRHLAAPELLDSYAEERRPHAHVRAEVSSAVMRAATASNWFLQRLRDGILSRLSALDAVQERLRDAVSDVGGNYRKSAIVCDSGGGSTLRAGDRAPDCETVDETQSRFRMFELLREPTHTALAVAPQSEPQLQRFAEVVARFQDVMQGCVLIDGDETFHNRYAHRMGMLYVVRPDGYIGFRGAATDAEALENWCSEMFSV